nr:hypothetical protein Iba_chr15bCG2080 [Ipomoea batatas]
MPGRRDQRSNHGGRPHRKSHQHDTRVLRQGKATKGLLSICARTYPGCRPQLPCSLERNNTTTQQQWRNPSREENCNVGGLKKRNVMEMEAFTVAEVAGDHIQHQLAPQICEALQPYAYRRQYFVALAFWFAESEPNSFVQSNMDSGGPDNSKIHKFQLKKTSQMMLKLEGNYTTTNLAQLLTSSTIPG